LSGNILVTGGLGFIGLHIVSALASIPGLTIKQHESKTEKALKLRGVT